MKTACAIIIYHPDESVLGNLSSYESFPGDVYVMDNSEKEDSPVTRTIAKFAHVKYFRDGMNKGIGARLNQASGLALASGYEWLLTMDQDSFFDPALLQKYFDCAAGYAAEPDIAMMGVNYNVPAGDSTDCQPRRVDQLITSGSLMNLTLFNRIGKFDEDLFIDGVDTDYCLKCRLAGYRLLRFDNIVLDHRIGLVSSHRSLKNGALTSRSLHSPIRLYYMTRNYLYLRKRYRATFPADIHEHRRDLLQRIKNNLFYGKDRIAVLTYILRGIRAYYSGRVNKIT